MLHSQVGDPVISRRGRWEDYEQAEDFEGLLPERAITFAVFPLSHYPMNH